MKTIGDVLEALRALPPGTLLDVTAVIAWLEPVAVTPAGGVPDHLAQQESGWTWRERLWTVPADTRLGLPELCEALGRSPSWVYRLTGAKRIPHRKMDGELVFLAGEIRAWLRDREEKVPVCPHLDEGGVRFGIHREVLNSSARARNLTRGLDR